MFKQPKVYMIHGFIGSGKTTFAKKLEMETKAVRFTHDEWMTELYGTNPPADMFGVYHERVSKLIWGLTERLIQNGQSVILDFGFWSRKGRDEARQRTTQMGAIHQLYALSCPDSVMLGRTLARTASMPKGALEITEETFNTLRERFEPLGEDEVKEVIATS